MKVAIGGSALVAIFGVNALFSERSIGPNGDLSTAAASIFRCVALVVLDGSLEANPKARANQLDRHINQLERLLSALPEPVQSDLSLLLSILENSTGRYAFAQLREPWSEATVEEASAALQMMRTSTLTMRQQAYHALRDLTNAAFYAEPSAWTLMGYPGPRDL